MNRTEWAALAAAVVAGILGVLDVLIGAAHVSRWYPAIIIAGLCTGSCSWIVTASNYRRANELNVKLLRTRGGQS